MPSPWDYNKALQGTQIASSKNNNDSTMIAATASSKLDNVPSHHADLSMKTISPRLRRNPLLRTANKIVGGVTAKGRTKEDTEDSSTNSYDSFPLIETTNASTMDSEKNAPAASTLPVAILRSPFSPRNKLGNRRFFRRSSSNETSEDKTGAPENKPFPITKRINLQNQPKRQTKTLADLVGHSANNLLSFASMNGTDDEDTTTCDTSIDNGPEERCSPHSSKSRSGNSTVDVPLPPNRSPSSDPNAPDSRLPARNTHQRFLQELRQESWKRQKIEVLPGKYFSFCSSEETLNAFLSEAALQFDCPACGTFLYCVPASMVMCSECQTVSPLQTNGKEKLALGMTVEQILQLTEY